MKTMTCSSCNAPATKLVEVFVKSWADPKYLDRPRSSRLCEKCLIGWTVPVFRRNRKKWELGTVEEYNQHTSEHSLRFMDDETYWAVVEASPFERYINHCKMTLLEGHTNESHLQIRNGQNGNSTKKRAPFEFGNDAKSFHPSSLSKSVPDPSEKDDSVRQLSGLKLASAGKESFIKNCCIHKAKESNMEEEERESLQNSSIDNNKESSEMTSTTCSPDQPTKCSPDQPTTTTQRLWTPEEDKKLQETIASNNYHLRWSMIAKGIPGRSGKQCRERYLNHLKPSLKLAHWSALEDVLIFRVYHVEGSKWSLMSKLLRGRTDNSIKNRYHHLKRRLERRIQTINSSAEMEALSKKLSKCRPLRTTEGYPFLMKYLAAHILSGRHSILDRDENSFGPFRPCTGDEVCARCGLMIPSAQTGRLVCESTGWCETCTRLSPCVDGDTLRLVHRKPAKA